MLSARMRKRKWSGSSASFPALQLRARAVNEKDPERLMALVAEIDGLLEAKEQHSKGESTQSGD
jgi:hypothetical protein